MEEVSSSELVSFTDKSGHVYKLLKYDGMYFPVPWTEYTFHKNTQELHRLDVTEKDVFILAFPKSGTHWVYEMVGMLLKGKAETISEVKEHTMIDIKPIDEVNSMPSPKVLNSHYLPKYFPLDILRKCKLVYLLRNPKDVVVSKYGHVFKIHPRTYDGEFSDFLELFLSEIVSYGSWFDYVRTFETFFEEHPELNPLILNYEDTIKDPIDTVRKLAKHLNVEYGDEFLREVAEACHIDKMKANNTKRDDFSSQSTIDGKSPMYRKGKVGDWKNWFTVANSEKFDAVYEEKMKGSKLKFTFEL